MVVFTKYGIFISEESCDKMKPMLQKVEWAEPERPAKDSIFPYESMQAYCRAPTMYKATRGTKICNP